MSDYKPNVKSNFKVEIDGIDFGNFSSVSGLNATAEITEDVGGMDQSGKKVAGKVSYDPVTLTRNCDASDSKLRDWFDSKDEKNVSIVFTDKSGDEKARRNLMSCVPSSHSTSDLSSQDSSVLTETITVVFSDAEWESA
jgi:phage tail-like protein